MIPLTSSNDGCFVRTSAPQQILGKVESGLLEPFRNGVQMLRLVNDMIALVGGDDVCVVPHLGPEQLWVLDRPFPKCIIVIYSYGLVSWDDLVKYMCGEIHTQFLVLMLGLHELAEFLHVCVLWMRRCPEAFGIGRQCVFRDKRRSVRSHGHSFS